MMPRIMVARDGVTYRSRQLVAAVCGRMSGRLVSRLLTVANGTPEEQLREEAVGEQLTRRRDRNEVRRRVECELRSRRKGSGESGASDRTQ